MTVGRVRCFCGATWLALCLLDGGRATPADTGAEYLSDLVSRGRVKHQQQWGTLGLDIAARQSGGRHPIRIGETTYPKGLGHHANGKIVVQLNGEYTDFHAHVGVQWQGGRRGSVVFRILVDGRLSFESNALSDSSPPQRVHLSVAGARELQLIASDGGDGIACDMANWAEARLLRDPRRPFFAAVEMSLGGEPAPPPSASVCGFSIVARDRGPQVAILEPERALTASVASGEDVRISIPLRNVKSLLRVRAEALLVHGEEAEISLSLGGHSACRKVLRQGAALLEVRQKRATERAAIILSTRAAGAESAVRWRHLRYWVDGNWFDTPLRIQRGEAGKLPPPELPDPRPSTARELVEWDWCMQDGIGTQRHPSTWAAAVEKTFRRGDGLIDDLAAKGVPLEDLLAEWERCRGEQAALASLEAQDDRRWEALWRRVHVLRRRIVFRNPLAKIGPLLFVKQVPGSFSHQLTQYYGRCAQPGGGIFVLNEPGESMQCRQVGAGALPPGSYQHPEISYDGRRLLFAYCRADSPSKDWRSEKRTYHLYEMGVDGTAPRQITDGPFDDFAPRYLPGGNIVFISTRRTGFHRCGRGPCPVYTLATVNRDGSDLRVISYHETHEWDPAVLNDGRIIYTRWDYVDRHAVHYQQLWVVRPDGTGPSIYYGNNTFNPVGVWEARPVPRSHRVMATAAAHHAMTAGSIVLVDVAKGVDHLEPLTRLTRDVLFPESESPVQQWHAPVGVVAQPPTPVEQKRWPGHCYRSPYPLSERYFLAAYSFDSLIGEPRANPANMFGIYLVDGFGNKELLYRDLNISSLWPAPLRPRARPPVVPTAAEPTGRREGTFFLQNVYESWPRLPGGRKDRIERLRILQVLLKSTPHINQPRVGLANASPGKQVLGTVPVEPDGSAYFRAPAGVPLAFQALDRRGRAVQIMRSITYLQPGENAACVGCHEHRLSSPPAGSLAQALARPPSVIRPGPDGSRPLSYPLLVQPVLDEHCVRCHSGPEAAEGIVLTGEPHGEFTMSYNTLAPRVPHSAWTGGDFREKNSEPLTRPGFFGARASTLMNLLLEGHEKVRLSDEDIERLVTWMDANALFYGTFDPESQARQRHGERISGPALE